MPKNILSAALALLSIFSCSCDSGEPAAGKGSANTARDGGPEVRQASAPAEAVATGPATFNSLSECLASCERGDVIPTNRETCRLSCDNAYGADAGARGAGVAADPIGRAAECLGKCHGGSEGPDACAAACKSAAAGGSSPPPADVIDRLGACVETCHADPSVRPTNRKTCELNCAQAARVAATPAPGSRP